MNRTDAHGRLAVAAVVTFLATAHAASFFTPSTWINRDGRFYTNMNVTLVEDGSLEQSRFASSWYDGAQGWNRHLPASFSNVALGRHGEHWPMHPWLMPVSSTPFYVAFGLVGTLLFNLLGFGVIAAGAFRIAREEASSVGAAAATVVFLLGTAILAYAYDYHVDVFLLACLATGLSALLDRRGWFAGAFIAATLALKPTTLLLVPHALVLLWARRDLVTLRHAVAGGALVLAVVGAANTFMFGAPWVFGYMRVLIVVDGVRTLESDVDAFGTPLAAGLARLWRGHWGVRHEMTLLLLAAPGLIALGSRRRWALLASTVATVGAAVLIFAKYHYEGHRFLWPALLTLVPALALSADLLDGAVRRIMARFRAGQRGAGGEPRLACSGRDGAAIRAGALVFGLAICGQLAALAFGPPPAVRLAQDPVAVGALTLASGRLRPDELPGRDAAALVAATRPMTTETRFGGVVPRAPWPVLLATTPFAFLGSATGVALFGALLASATWLLAALLATTWARPTLVVATLGGLSLLPAVRGGSGAVGFALAAALAVGAVACHQRRPGHPPVSGAVAGSALAAWCAEAPAMLLVPIGMVALAMARDPRAARRPAAVLAGVAIAWGLGHLVLYGSPFAPVSDHVRVGLGAGVEPVALDATFLGVRLLREWASPGPGRLVAIVAGTSLLAMAGLIGRRRSTALLLAGLWTGTVLVPLPDDTPTSAALPLAVAGTGLALPLLFAAPGRRVLRLWSDASLGRRWATAGILVAALFVAGAVRAAVATASPAALQDRATVRRAVVTLGDVPCDFLAWEHYAWECSHYDRGAMNLTGLVTSVAKTVGGRRVDDGFVLASGPRGRPRRVVVPAGVLGSGPLRWRWAVPDGLRGGGELRVGGSDGASDRLLVPLEPTGAFAERTTTVPADGSVVFEMTPGPTGPSTVLLQTR